MSEAHKSTLAKANAAIARGDVDGFLACCTDDTTWTFVGDRTLEGKDSVRAWMAETYQEPPSFVVQHMVAEGDHVVALGRITLKDAEGRPTLHAYSDVWRFRDGLMAELQAYVVELPGPPGDAGAARA